MFFVPDGGVHPYTKGRPLSENHFIIEKKNIRVSKGCDVVTFILLLVIHPAVIFK